MNYQQFGIYAEDDDFFTNQNSFNLSSLADISTIESISSQFYSSPKAETSCLTLSDSNYFSSSSNESNTFIDLRTIELSPFALPSYLDSIDLPTALELFNNNFSMQTDDFIENYVAKHSEKIVPVSFEESPIIVLSSSSSSSEEKCVDSVEPEIRPKKRQRRTKKEKILKTKFVKEPVECSQCKKVFRAKWYLKQHLKVYHLQEKKQFKCTKCGKSFATLEELNVHSAKHSAVKQFKCDECSKSFVHKQDLKRHRYNHTNQKPFSCQFCHKGFARRDALAQHEIGCERKTIKRRKKLENSENKVKIVNN